MTRIVASGRTFKQKIEDLEWQDHVCYVYDLDQEWQEAASGFLAAGLTRGERGCCLLPAGFWTGQKTRCADDAILFQRAMEKGCLLHPHDEDMLVAWLADLQVFFEKLRAHCSAAGFTGCRCIVDMHWLQRCGIPEQVRGDFLLWLNQSMADMPLLALCGYARQHAAPAELQVAFARHSYVCHAGHLLPGGFGMEPGYGHARRLGLSISKGRRPFRRGPVLDAIFKAAPFALWILNRNRQVVFVNQQVCDTLGVSEEQILSGAWLPAAGAGEYGTFFGMHDPAVYEAGGPVETELSLMHADGCLHDYRVIRTRVMGDDGQIEGILGLALDITDRKIAEKRLRQSERRFRDIALEVGDLIWEVGPNWRFRYLSEKAKDILGYEADRLVGRSLAELDNAAPQETWQVLFRALEAAPTRFRNVEKWWQTPDGRQRCLLLSGVPVIGEDGRPGGFRGVAEDITERKQQEANLKSALWQAEDARDKIDSILRSITDALIVVDSGGRFVMLNPAAEDLFGTTAEQALGASVYALCPGSNVSDAIRRLMADVATGSAVDEICLAWPAESARRQTYFKARASQVRNLQGDGPGVIVLFQDMTREREMERLKTEFISTAAHELRTPLTSIMGYLEFCMHPEEFGGFPDAQLREFMAEIYDKAEVLERIVSDLLDISRMDAGREIPLIMETVDVSQVSRKILQHFQLQFPAYRFEMVFAPEISHRVQADRQKLVQVLENLVSNAVKYSPEGSVVRVSGASEGTAYRISVCDRGIGMTPQQIARMFEKFYRAVDLNSGVRGLGLGMHIVKHIIERHGGTIAVHSQPGKGTEIIVNLPLGG